MQLLSLYRGLIRPCMEYSSHVWGGSPATRLLDRVESKAIRLINSPPLTDSLQPLSLRRNVASLSVYYRYYTGHCSSELSECMLPPLRRARNTRQASYSHPFSVQLPNARIDRYSHSFIYTTGQLWNTLPLSIFPHNYDLNSFKRNVSRHLDRTLR